MICNPPTKKKHSPLLRIANPQSLNRLGHFLTPDCKSGGTPGGLAFLNKKQKGQKHLKTMLLPFYYIYYTRYMHYALYIIHYISF